MMMFQFFQGYLFEYSVLFYGYYDSGQNETYFAPPHNPRPYIGGYKLPLAYVLVIIFIFVISGGAILYRLANLWVGEGKCTKDKKLVSELIF